MTDQRESSRAGRRGGRPRSPEAHRAILEATEQVLRERGYAGLSLDEIARRAEVGKRTIYRWWPSKGALVAEAFREGVTQRHPDVDTGSVRADLTTYFTRLFTDVATPGKATALRSMMAEAQTDTGFAADFGNFIAERRALVREMLARGVARGELDTAADLDLAVDILFGTYWYRLLTGHLSGAGLLDATSASALVDGALRAIS